jgi:hypothetical protein
VGLVRLPDVGIIVAGVDAFHAEIFGGNVETAYTTEQIGNLDLSRSLRL